MNDNELIEKIKNMSIDEKRELVISKRLWNKIKKNVGTIKKILVDDKEFAIELIKGIVNGFSGVINDYSCPEIKKLKTAVAILYNISNGYEIIEEDFKHLGKDTIELRQLMKDLCRIEIGIQFDCNKDYQYDPQWLEWVDWQMELLRTEIAGNNCEEDMNW